MVICKLEFSLTDDTRHENLTNIDPDRQVQYSNLVNYQKCQQFHPNVSTSDNESPSRSETALGSEATEFKILISAHKSEKLQEQ